MQLYCVNLEYKILKLDNEYELLKFLYIVNIGCFQFASLDTRIQLACVRCQQPAKVTEETSGEIWAECTRVTCAYQFCKYCACDRHPGKSCIRYDLDGPSPSKRKKKTCAAGSKQSKTNLRRLLIK